ncbi:ABC transporter ATP-binding protein [Paenibacillus pinistramenti]|uniref:iron ABC transporter ATP-binding protein n=1 Tax=Paenibacillus pinistramenti TaxID=1768003 RepID=UPI00110985CC|nr:ABC transporter ATP-binding protein [Paenibacillus pinistramenti]
MINVRNVTKRYGDTSVVNDVSLEIKLGKITSFIGPNGAGKSTLLSMMSRLAAIDEGEVVIEGKNLAQWNTKELARKLSVLKQTNQISIRLTVEDLVAYGRFPYSQGRLKAEDRKFIEEAITYMELGPFRGKYLDHLSGGQRQRAFIAMVIAQNTDYIFLDEPLNNLDMKHSVQIMRVLRRMVDDLGKTIVLVIHDINFASCYSDYIVALREGAIVSQGTTEEMIDTRVLKEIYDMTIPVETVGGQKICVYFS